VTAPLVFKLHLFMGMSLFVIFPFTRLVHVWSGLAPSPIWAAPISWCVHAKESSWVSQSMV
jgi:nitrate reductase gamma subunit